VAGVAQGPLLAAQGYQPVARIGTDDVFGVGAYRNPPGWRPRWYWTGAIVECGDAKRKHRSYPRLVLPHNHAAEQKIATTPGHVLATTMPAEVKDMALDYYGHDLTPEMRAILADRIAERAKPKAAPAPVQTQKRTAKPKGRKR